MPIHRCARCRAEDISSDAHPTRVLAANDVVPVFVCRGCYRPAELEFRIACESRGIPYAPPSIRESLRRLAFFYRDRLAEWDDERFLIEDDEREREKAPIREALERVERRLSLAVVE